MTDLFKEVGSASFQLRRLKIKEIYLHIHNLDNAIFQPSKLKLVPNFMT